MRWKTYFGLGLAGLALLGVVAWPVDSADAAADLPRGDVELASVGALALGPDNILFVGDSDAARVVALEVEIPEAAADYETIEDLDGKIAAMLGIGARDVYVKDMVVHQPSGTVFLSVMRGDGDDALPVLLRVARDGTIGEVALEGVRYSTLALGDAPAEGEKLYRWSARSLSITDLEYIDGELYVAGLSNEEFASTLRRAAFPFGDAPVSTGLEIYHGAHGAWETHAPIFSFIPYEIAGDRHLLAGYLCTPLVTFPLDEVRSKDRLRGKTIAELGWGNIPTDLVDYEHEGERYLLIANSSRGTMKLKAADIVAAQAREGITSEAGPREGVDYHTAPLGSVAQIAMFDDEHILVLTRSMENGALSLAIRSKDWV